MTPRELNKNLNALPAAKQTNKKIEGYFNLFPVQYKLIGHLCSRMGAEQHVAEGTLCPSSAAPPKPHGFGSF